MVFAVTTSLESKKTSSVSVDRGRRVETSLLITRLVLFLEPFEDKSCKALLSLIKKSVVGVSSLLFYLFPN